MNDDFNNAKGFGEILDHTFRLSKNKFADFFLILLIFMGPIYLIQAIFQLLAGTSFFREIGGGSNWFEQVTSSFEQPTTTSSPIENIGLFFVGLASIILFPVAQAAVMYAIENIRKNETFTISSVIKRAFSRFWPIFGSSLLFAVIVFGLIFVPLIIVILVGVLGTMNNPIVGIITAIVLFLGFTIGLGLLITRWSFYFGAVVIDKEAPGLSRSWQLSKKRTWISFGLYIVFFLIIGVVSGVLELIFSALLGNSVLMSMIVNLISIVTTLFLSVGYAIMYFDLKIRHDGEDLQEMLDEYKN